MTAGVLFQIYKFKLLNSGVLIINFEQVPHVITVLLTLNKTELDSINMFKVNNKDTRATPLASFWYLYY